jgi:hypothetical protein
LAIENEFDEVIIDGSEEKCQVSRCNSQPLVVKSRKRELKEVKKKTELRI